MKIRLTKISELPDAIWKMNIEEGFVKEGELVAEPKVGEPFYVGNGWRTSYVKEIIDQNTFKTCNSIYRWQIIEPGPICPNDDQQCDLYDSLSCSAPCAICKRNSTSSRSLEGIKNIRDQVKKEFPWLSEFSESAQTIAIDEILWYRRNGITAPTNLIHESLKRGSYETRQR